MSTGSYDETSRSKDNIKRGVKKPNPLGTGLFVGLRALDPVLQYNVLSQNYGQTIIDKLGGTTLPHGPPLITNTFFDRLGLSPYRSILFAMAMGSMIKQNIHITTIAQEEFPPGTAVMVSAFNTVLNSLNNLFFICAQTSASVNGEHFPQTPLIVGTTLYAVGISVELVSELQRHAFKKDPANKGKVYEGGLFSLARHINYGGYTLWRTGYALAAGGWVWGSIVGAFFVYDFTQRGIPVLQHYCVERVSCGGRVCWSLVLIADIWNSTVRSGSTTGSRRPTSFFRASIKWQRLCSVRLEQYLHYFVDVRLRNHDQTMVWLGNTALLHQTHHQLR